MASVPVHHRGRARTAYDVSVPRIPLGATELPQAGLLGAEAVWRQVFSRILRKAAVAAQTVSSSGSWSPFLLHSLPRMVAS